MITVTSGAKPIVFVLGRNVRQYFTLAHSGALSAS